MHCQITGDTFEIIAQNVLRLEYYTMSRYDLPIRDVHKNVRFTDACIMKHTWIQETLCSLVDKMILILFFINIMQLCENLMNI